MSKMVLAHTPKRPQSAHDKKRHGQHHKHTKHYEKTYWPYLPLLVIIVLGLSVNGWLGRQQHVLGVQTGVTGTSLLQATNAQRTSDHESSLTINAQLASAAQTKADDMAAHNYWSHDTPSGETPWAFIQQSGYRYQAAGENLAYGFTSGNAAIAGWMNSAEHRANILDAAYQNVGFGIASAPNYQGRGPATIIVAFYAEPTQANATSAVLGAETRAPSQSVARVQLLTEGSAPWSVAILSFLAGGCIVLVVVRHGLFLRRAFAKSEAFIIHHPLLDVALVFVGMCGFILTRTSGFIR